MSRKVRLRAQSGTDEANHAGKLYRVNNDHIVEVDEEAVGPLVERGGFELAEPDVDPVQPGFVRARAVGIAGCSWGGQNFEPDADGVFNVPIGSMDDLAPHGFVGIED